MSLSAELSCLQGGVGGGGGAEEREASLASLEKQLTCPICLEIFNKPVVILPCQHNLCRKCANELYQPSLFQARTTMMVNSGRFRCPSCRHEVVLDRHGVYGLQRNLLVENIIDVYKQEASSSNSISSSSPAPLPPPLPAELTCSHHQGEKVNIYCLTCQAPTCSLCKVFGAHQSCQVAPLTDVCQQRKDDLNEGITAVTMFNSKIQAVIDELDQTCRTIEENCKTEKQNVCEKFSRMFSILQERQKAMVQRISDEQDEKTGHILALTRCHGDSVEANNKLVESAKSSMEEPDMAVFVQNSRELIAKVMSASSSSPHEALKPDCENPKLYRFPFSRQERALRSIDFLKGAKGLEVVEDVPEVPDVAPEPENPKEASIQNHPVQNSESVTQPANARMTSLMPPPEEPATPPPAPPSGQTREPLEVPVEAMQPQTEQQDSNHVRSGPNKVPKQEEEQRRCAVKEGLICEQQDGMSTQQLPSHSTYQTPTDPAFCPSWYKSASSDNISPVSPPPEGNLPNGNDAEETVQQDDLSTFKADTKIEPGTLKQPQDSLVVCGAPHGLESFLHLQLPLSTLLHAEPYQPAPHSSESRLGEPPLETTMPGPCKPAGGAGAIEKEVNLPEAAEQSLDPGEDDSFRQNQETGLSPSRMEEVVFDGDVPRLEEASEPKEKELKEEEDVEEEDEGLEEGRVGVVKSEDDEPTKGPDDIAADEGTSSSESAEKVTSCVSLQAFTLLFYLLAFLVILQRVWAYIGCFICT